MMRRMIASLFLLLARCAQPGAPDAGAPTRVLDGAAAVEDHRADAGQVRTEDAAAAADGAEAPDAGTREDAMSSEDAEPSTEAAFDVARWRRSVIYFVMTDRFVDGDPNNNGSSECYDPTAPNLFHGGDFAGIQQRLGYLEELGVDALWITPIPIQVPRRGDWCGYHGYWADLDDPDDGLLEPRLGTEDELRGLIDEMHARSQRLIIDMVVNHPGRDARITRTHPEWFHPWEGCSSLGSPDLFCDLSGLPDFAHERPEVVAYLNEHSRSWMRRFAFDGIRMDTVKHVPVSYFADDFVPAVLEERPALYLMGEIFDEGSYDLPVRYHSAGFHGFLDFPLRRALIESLARGGSLARVALRVREVIDRLGLDYALLRPTFIDNHDVPRFPREMQSAYADDKKAELHRLALAVLFLSPGIPQLYMGNELGAAHADHREDFPTWAFEPVQRRGAKPGWVGDPADTFDFVAELSRLRRSIPALHEGHYVELWRPDGGAEIWAFYRRTGSSRVVVVLNGGDQRVEDHLLPIGRNSRLTSEDLAAMHESMPWQQVLGGSEARLEFDEDRAWVTVGPRSVSVYTLP